MTNENLDNNALIQGNLASNESTKPKLSLSKFLAREGLNKNSDGKYAPNNQQLKNLVCYDEINLGDIDTSNITNMKDLFKNSTRKDFGGIDKWNVDSVTTFMSAFEGAENFNEDISQWNVSNATNFMQMFWNAKSFNQPIGKWKTTKATNTIRMFCNAKNFNQPLQDWDMHSVKWTWEMFAGAMNFNQPLDKWNVSNVEKMQSMFNRAENFNQDLSAWGNKLSKAQDMKRMFANTKALDINFLQDWQIPAGCIIENIIKGSKLEQILKNPKAQNAENKTQDKKRKLKDIAKFTISQIKNSNIFKETCANLSKNNGFLVNQNSWIPNNILNGYNVYLGKDNNDINGKNKIIKANIDDFSYVFCRIFDDINLIISIDDANIPFSEIKKIDTFEVYQAKNIKEFNELNGDDEINNKYDKSHTIRKDIEFYLADDSMLIINKDDDIGDNSNIISDIINTYILAKAYKAKMQQLNTLASEYKEKNWCGKILDFLCFWKIDVLHQVHKDICTFDLKYYQKDPVDKNKTVLNIWREMSKSYLVAQMHDELKETIRQVAELVSEENQKKFNYIMLAVAVFSALGAILAAVPVAQGLLN